MRLLRRAIRNVRRNTLRETAQTTFAVIEDQVFDWRYGVDTSGTVGLKDLAIDSPHVAHGVDYFPTRARYFREILDALRAPHDSVLVDLGSGKGRILLMAARSGRFRKVVGVEFSAELCRVAEENIRRFQRHCPSHVKFEVVHGDAADYDVQPDQTVFFMFNPFDDVVLRLVLDRLKHSLEEAPRQIWLIYLNVDEGCRKLLVDEGYEETGGLRYGNAAVSIFTNRTG
jgi:SAM-dependent methyltransferase